MQNALTYTQAIPQSQAADSSTKVRNYVLIAIGVTGLAVLGAKLIRKKVSDKTDAKSFQDGTPETSAKLIKMAFDNDGWFGTDVKALRDTLSRIKSKDEMEKVRQAYDKEFNSSLYRDMMKELQSTEYKEMMQIVEAKPAKPGQPVNPNQYGAWAKRLKAAFDKMYGFIPGTDEAAIKAVFNEIPSQKAFVEVGKAYAKEYKANLINDMKGELEIWEYPDYMKIITSKPKLNMARKKNIDAAPGQKKGNKKWLLLSLGAMATGVLSYFGYNYWNKNKQNSDEPSSEASHSATATRKPNTTSSPKAAQTAPKQSGPKKQNAGAKKPNNEQAAFPLKKGSRGELVKSLQQAIITKYGKQHLPTGADGIYGSELQKALKKLKLPEVIDQTTFNVIVKQPEIDADSLAKSLHTAATKKDFASITKLLKELRNVSGYTAVNAIFKNLPLRGVRQTLVNGILGTFKNDNQKETIRLSFVDLGLKFDGKKWSLSGIADDGKLLITTKPTMVWKNPKTSVKVPLNMVLGREIATRKNYTLFENDGGYFIVKSEHITEYKR